MVEMSVDELKGKIRDALEKHPNLKLAVLFGSYTKGIVNAMSDVDLLIDGELSESKLLLDLAESLNMPVERIDLIRLKQAPTKVLARALTQGEVISCREPKLLAEVAERVALDYPEVMNLYKLNLGYSLDPKDEVDEVRLLDLLNNAVKKSKLLEGLLKEYGVENFKKDEVLDSALRWPIYEIIQSMIDACAVLATSLKLGLAESYKDYVIALIKGNVMSEELGTDLIEFISLRNRLAHRYLYVEVEELVESSRRLVGKTLPAFREWMYATIKKYST